MQLENAQSPAPFLFANVDGVLTNASTCWLLEEGSSDVDLLDPTVLRLLEKLCKTLGAKVVMATSWVVRYTTAEEWRGIFAAKGVDIPVVDVLPMDDEAWWRKAQAYMASHPNSRWALLQDANLPPHLQALVSVNPLVGLTVKEAERVASCVAPGSAVAEQLKRLSIAYSKRG
jgi:hypothetical protein